MAASVVFLPFPCIHPVKPCWLLELLQLLLPPGVSDDICFPESSVPGVILVCRIGTSTPSVRFLRNEGCAMEAGTASLLLLLLLIHHFTLH